MKELFVVIDMQNDFITGALNNAAAQAILPDVIKAVQAAKKEGKQLLFTRDTHAKNYLNTTEGKYLPVEHCIQGTWGHEIADGLYVEGAAVIDKPTFGSKELAEYVQKGGFDKVELVGVCTDICVVTNALLIKTACPDTVVVVHEKLTAGVSAETHEAAIKTMRSCQVEIV